MKNSKRFIIFILSFFATLFYLSVMTIVLRPLTLISSTNTIQYIIYPIYSTSALFFFVCFQALLRHQFYGKILLNNSILLSVKADKVTITDRLWFYMFLGLIFARTIINGFSASPVVLITILILIIAVIVVELLLRFSINTIKINFLRNGILITGFDARISIPIAFLGSNIRNDYGFFSYNDIDGYFIFPDRIELFLLMERGKIIVETDSETKRQMMGIIAQQKIKLKKHL